MTGKVLMTGGTGFLGTALRHRLMELGWSITALSTSRTGEELGTSFVAPESLEELGPHDVVVNLAGEPIVGLWTAKKRKAIFQSRIETTQRLVDWMKTAPPAVFLSASGVDIYGDRGDEILTEDSAIGFGEGFMTRVAREWERAAMGAGCRTVLLRTSAVLSPDGGYLGTVLPIYRRFPIVVLGSRDSWFSWIALTDWVELAVRAVDDSAFEGPLNMAAPNPVRQGEFVRALAAKLDKRVWGRIPRWMLKLAMGELGETITGGRRAVPEKALAHGFQFEFELVSDFLERRL